MTFTYSGDPAASDLDAVRFLLGDTLSTEPLVTDEEIAYSLDKWYEEFGTHEYVAATLADSIAARYAREASISADGVNVNLGMVAQQYRELAASLRQQHKNLLVGGSPDVGGITPGEGLYPGLKNFAFGTGMHDNIDAGIQDLGSFEHNYLLPEEYPGA